MEFRANGSRFKFAVYLIKQDGPVSLLVIKASNLCSDNVYNVEHSFMNLSRGKLKSREIAATLAPF